MADETCTCTTLPDGTHYPACPASPYQAGIRSGRSQERAAIVAWMRAARVPHAQADAIERGDHLAKRETRVVDVVVKVPRPLMTPGDVVMRRHDATCGPPNGIAWTVEHIFTSGHDGEVTARIRASASPFTIRYVRVRHLVLAADQVVADVSPSPEPLRPLADETTERK